MTAAFLNYFQYGMDFLVSADGSVKKIIAYSNIVRQCKAWISD